MTALDAISSMFRSIFLTLSFSVPHKATKIFFSAKLAGNRILRRKFALNYLRFSHLSIAVTHSCKCRMCRLLMNAFLAGSFDSPFCIGPSEEAASTYASSSPILVPLAYLPDGFGI